MPYEMLINLAFSFRNDGIWTGQLVLSLTVLRLEYAYEIKHFGFERFQSGHRIFLFNGKYDPNIY